MIDGLERIRTSSVEPIIITGEFLERVSKVKQFCPHFHLSLQSGCNKIFEKKRYESQIYSRRISKSSRAN